MNKKEKKKSIEKIQETKLKKITNMTPKNKMVGSWIFTGIIMLWMIVVAIIDKPWPSHLIFDIGMIILALPVIFVFGRNTIRSSYIAIMHKNTNMDVLITLGVMASLVTGVANFFIEIANYSGIAAMIMTFHLTGRYIEAKAKGKASLAIKKLLELGAKTAKLIDKNGQEQEIKIEDVKINDILIVRPGEKIPIDGKIVEGESKIDESLATGESVSVRKKIGDEVIGATINQQGVLKIKVTKTGEKTFLSQIIKMVKELQGTKIPIQKFADKVTSVFVPTILIVALITFITWLVFPYQLGSIANFAQTFIPWVNPELNTLTSAIFATVAVLVIACPCALGLATPTALMVGSGIGAKNGILFRSGEAIQTLKDIEMIVFDKTGTLTKGKPEVTNIIGCEIKDERYIDKSASWCIAKNELLQIAASLENASEHPLARAIVNTAKKNNMEIFPIKNFESITSHGIKGDVDILKKNISVVVGNEKMFIKYGIAIPQDVLNTKLAFEDEGKTVVMVSINNHISGLIAIADTLKDDSVEAIAEFKKMNIKTAIISGDNLQTAQAIAKIVGIDDVLAEVLPEQKVDEIKKLQKKYKVVAMVGDGINDAPALKQANVGIAIGTGTDIAIESSDVTLVSGKLSAAVSAIKLSKATFKKIKQNLFWAFGYNIAAIPLAIIGLLHPVIAEIAMATSSISVITNANRLKNIKLNSDK